MLTEESVAGEERRVELSTVRAFGAARKFVGSSRQGRRGSGKRQNGLVGVRRSSWQFLSVSVKRGFLLIFISSFLLILPYRFEICQRQIV